MNRQFHWKRLLLLLGVLIVVGGVLFAVNQVQAKRQSSIIKTVAEKADARIDGDNGRRTEAIALYARYLKFQPKDEVAATRYAKLLFEHYKAEPTRRNADTTITGAEQFLRNFPDHASERRDLAELYVKTGKIPSAREHIEVLFKSPKGDFKRDVELLEMASLCEQMGGEPGEAIRYLEEAIATEKAPVRVYQMVLQLLNANRADSGRETKIANYIRTLLEKEPFRNNLEARIAVARFELFRRELENARRDVNYAMKSIPGGDSNSDVLLAAAELEIATPGDVAGVKGRLVAARDHLKKAFALDPKNVAVGLFLADVLEQQGNRAEAIQTLRETANGLGKINDQYWVVIDYLLDLGNQDLSATLLERGAASGKDDARLNYFRGRLAVLRSDWMQAKSLLEESAPHLAKLPAHHKRAMVGLAVVFGVLQNPDRQLECYRNAIRDDPGYVLALVGEAEALARLGHLDEAISKYRILVTTYQITGLRPILVRLRLVDTLRKPPENRNWELFDSDDTLGLPGTRTDETQILHAQGLAARGEKPRAIKLLDEVIDKDKNSTFASVAWVTKARIQEAGKPEAALAILEEAQQKVGDVVDLRLARADVLVFRAKPPTTAEFESLAAGAEKFNKPDQYRLWYGLGQAALNSLPRVPEGEARKSMQDAAIRFLRAAGTVEPRDLLCRAVLVDLALTSDRKDVLEPTIAELAVLEGPNGPISTLGRIVIRLPEVLKIENVEIRNAGIRELRELALKVQKQRPGWGRVYVALGRLDEKEGLTEQAVENYRKAIKEGDREEAVIRKAVQLYRERKQDALAAGMLDELSTKMILPDDLERFRAIFEMLNRVVPRSERPTIDRIAPAESRDYRIQLLRGSLLTAIRDEVEAVKAFRRAVELDENNPEAWEALIRQLVRTSDLPAARQALIEAEKKLLLAPQKSEAAKADLLIVLGGCHELVGDEKSAGNRYEEALRTAPKELNPNRKMVQFLMRIGQSAEADKLLATLSEASGQDLARWARRYFAAVSLMSRPDAYHQRHKALALIARNLQVDSKDPEDLKAQAVIKTIDPVTREEGVQVLKDYWARGELTPDESYHLGMLVFGLGPTKIAESVKFFESAAKPRPGVTTEHIAGLIRVYAAVPNLGIAEATLDRLKAAAPNSWEATREESRLLMKKSRDATIKGDRDDAAKWSDQARALILQFRGYDTAEAIRTRSGPLLAELGFVADAELLDRRLLTIWDSPVAHVPLAILYVTQKRPADAIDLAYEREARAPILVTAQLLTGAIRVKRPDKEREKKVEQWLEGKIRDYAGKAELPGLIGARAEFLDAVGKYPESIAEYRRAVSDKSSELATNNLAMLLALTRPDQVNDAIRVMTDLIALRGPVPTYLDTRAVAYIVKGGDDVAKAVQDLEMARLQNPRPVYAFHLAWAYDLQLKTSERDKLLDEALKLGISSDDVHPKELETFRRLFKVIGAEPK